MQPLISNITDLGPHFQRDSIIWLRGWMAWKKDLAFIRMCKLSYPCAELTLTLYDYIIHRYEWSEN
jgi:hypothetical protein